MSLGVSEALARRRSTRAFLDVPVPEVVVRDILEAAARTASSSNMQPWRIAVMTGADLDAFKAAVRRSLWKNPRGEGAAYKIYADDLKEPYDRRRRQVAADMYATVGVAHDDKPGRLMHFARNFDFFGAPVGMILSLDRSHPPGQWADVGMFLQSLLLLAEERHLATCAQAAWAVMPRTIRAHLRLPEEQIVYCGVALGHADPSHPMNGELSP